MFSILIFRLFCLCFPSPLGLFFLLFLFNPSPLFFSLLVFCYIDFFSSVLYIFSRLCSPLLQFFPVFTFLLFTSLLSLLFTRRRYTKAARARLTHGSAYAPTLDLRWRLPSIRTFFTFLIIPIRATFRPAEFFSCHPQTFLSVLLWSFVSLSCPQ